MPTPPMSNIESLGKADFLPTDVTSQYPSPNDVSSNAYAYMAASTAADGMMPVPSHVLPVINPYAPQPNGVMASTHVAQQMTGVLSVDMDLHGAMQRQATSAFPGPFASTQPAMSMVVANDAMQGVMQIKPEPVSNANSPSSNPSLGASPVPSSFPNPPSSALSSVLDESSAAQIARSRSGSLVSPTGIPSTSAMQSRATPPNDSSFTFGLADFQGMNTRPDPANAPHMLAVGEVLAGIAKAANSAREACSLGQGAEASNKIDEMRRQISLVSKLMAEARLDGPDNQNAFAGLVDIMNAGQGHRASNSFSGRTGLVQPPGLIPNFPSTTVLGAAVPSSVSSDPLLSASSEVMNPPTSASSTASSDVDGPRKRCATTMAGSRIQKALRLDALEDGFPPLTQPATPPVSSASMGMPSYPPHPLSAQPITSAGVIVSPPAMVPPVSAPAPLAGLHPGPTRRTPPSGPSSRPASPGIGYKRGTGIMAWPVSAPSVPSSLGSQQPLYALSMNTDDGYASATGSHVNSPTTSRPPGWADAALNNTLPPSALAPVSTNVPVNVGLNGLTAMHPSDLALQGSSSLPYGAPPFSAPPTVAVPTITRDSRSSSLSNPLSNPLVFGADPNSGPIHPSDMMSSSMQMAPGVGLNGLNGRSRASSYPQPQSAPLSPTASSDESDSEDETDLSPVSRSGPHKRSAYSTLNKYSPPLKSRDSSRERLRTRMNGTASGAAADQTAANGLHGNDIPGELRAEVDRIFFEFLNKVCSNLDATDAKGEPIHQTLMAKKMQRLAESADFRPFKFRIQAFTNGFLEELSKQGYPEEKIAMKKVRNYLWSQPYISRFNEDGKKAKSKGNHIWNIEAKKRSEGGWDFRPFHRKLAGSPPSVAYIGLRWAWTPRIWDPQASRASIHVQFSSPNLPPWMTWHDGTLQGIPPPEAQSCDLTVEARSMHDGHNEMLSQTFHINVSPVTATNDISFSSTRPILGNDLNRRATSDSAVPIVTGASNRHSPVNSAPPPPSMSHQDAQMIQVLTSASQRVEQEMIAHVRETDADPLASQVGNTEMEALVKQQHVLEVTREALNNEVSSNSASEVTPSSHALVAVAQQVVFQAARQVATDHAIQAVAASTDPAVPPPPQVTVNEVSVATQTAVKQAVDITGPLSSEVDVMMTASSLLQHQTQTRAAPMMPPVDPLRPHSTGTLTAPVYPPPPMPPSMAYPMNAVPQSSMDIVQY